MIITADEARVLMEKSIRRNTDISKTQTIMKNIKSRAEKGISYFEYMAHVNYAIAKTLIEREFKLYRKTRDGNVELKLEDFKNGKTFYSVRIDWSE